MEQNQAWIAPTIAADGHGRGSEMWRRLWGIMSDLGWDCQIFQVLIKKTFVSIKQFWGKSGKHDFWTIVSYYEGSPFLIVRMLTHYCPKVRKRDNV